MVKITECDRCRIYAPAGAKNWGFLNNMFREYDLCPKCGKLWKKIIGKIRKKETIAYKKAKEDFLEN